MGFKEVAESKELYIASATAVVLVVIIMSIYFVKCYRHALECGVTKEVLKRVMKSSALFSIIPSLAIVTGLVTLVAIIGLPYAWLRLSVIGSLAYEIMSSNMALEVLGIDLAVADGKAFGLIMWAMCLGITLPLILNSILCKPVHLGAMKLGKGEEGYRLLSQTTFMSALMIALIIPIVGGGMVSCATLLISAAISILISWLAERFNAEWLHSFNLAVTLIGAMTFAVILDSLL